MRLIEGDCLKEMRCLDAASIDAIITDPPYELGFMGNKWDKSGTANVVEIWKECLRVAKPGAHLLAFGAPRTFHRMTCAIEDAGWDIKDCLMWLQSQGFPKSRNMKGEWDGWGTALKPAWEPVVLACKPIAEKSVSKNMQRYGTGALNIEATKIGEGGQKGGAKAVSIYGSKGGYESGQNKVYKGGRWPSNLLIDECVAEMVDAQSSAKPSRYFYCAKANTKERTLGMPDGIKCEHPTIKPIALMEYLCRLITQPSGMILDPFMGSGTTGIAAARCGFRFIGIEQSGEYINWAQSRIEYWSYAE